MNKKTFLVLVLTLFTSGICYADSFRVATDLRELVQDAELIVMGKLDEVLDSYSFHGYQGNAPLLNARDDSDVPVRISLPATDYLIKVNKILKPAKRKGLKSIVLRMVGQKVESVDKFNQEIAKQPGRVKKQLFFLNSNPDGTYGVSTVASIMHFKQDADEEQLVYKVGKDTYTLSGVPGHAKKALAEILRLADIQ